LKAARVFWRETDTCNVNEEDVLAEVAPAGEVRTSARGNGGDANIV
jgi:hypothetical protein